MGRGGGVSDQNLSSVVGNYIREIRNLVPTQHEILSHVHERNTSPFHLDSKTVLVKAIFNINTHMAKVPRNLCASFQSTALAERCIRKRGSRGFLLLRVSRYEFALSYLFC